MDFTYFLSSEDSLIKSVRVIKEGEYFVLTIYYYYRSLKFDKDRESIIFNWSKDHKLKYHQKEDPFDWHVHIQVKTKKDLVQRLKSLDVPSSDIGNIKELLSGNKLSLKNVQYEGAEDIKMYKELKKITKKEIFDFEVLKGDVIDEMYLFLTFYFLRFSNLEFRITDNLLELLGSTDPKDLNDSTDNYNFNYKNPVKAREAFSEYKKLIITSYRDYHKKDRKVDLKYYMNLRLTVELAWNTIKAKSELDKLKAYFLFYRRFQNSFNSKECKFKIDFNDHFFDKMLQRVKKKIKTANNESIDFDASHIFLRSNSRGSRSPKGRATPTNTNPNLDGGDPAVPAAMS